ncbi:MAG: proline--tRNA ligase [Chloroflexi bacterium]|nr:proline--tRNA ligase [Chloroflexota bacterium]
MRMNHFFSQTLRENQAETEVIGHQHLLRAGYVRQLAAGIFSYLHLGQRTLTKIEAIMRDEIDRIGGQEMKMPVIHPADIWQESGRWYEIDDEMGRFEDKNGRSMTLAMTHEEVVTDLARREIHSYKQMPQLIYHFQLKWRDDPRPRAGLIRAREFNMLDSYSLDKDDAGLDAQYQAHFDAYFRIFARCGLPVMAVEADVGMMGGKLAHEYMYLTPIGEDTLLLCDSCGYQANRQVAVFRKSKSNQTETTYFVASMLENQETVPQIVQAIVTAGQTVNETKLANVVNALRLHTADATQIEAAKHMLVVVDNAVADTAVSQTATFIADITVAEEGAICAECGSPMHAVRGVEVANIFKLGTHFSESMGATFMGQNGRSQSIIMGSYGIGVTRLLACLAEHHQDERGLCWPTAIAPYDVHLVSLSGGEETAVSLYEQLRNAGIDVFFDDRDERAGVKFKDADLIGIPIRLTVSKRSLAQGGVELHCRQSGEKELVAETAVDTLIERIKNTPS